MTTARAFSEVILPALVQDLGPACAAVNAVVQIYATSDDEDVASVVVLNSQPAVHAGEDPDADVFLSVDEAILPALLTGTLDVPQALADGNLDAEGDLDVLKRLAAVLEGGKSALGVRLGQRLGQMSKGGRAW